jgi:glycosyltransferase involved in cell wall biosynthesis
MRKEIRAGDGTGAIQMSDGSRPELSIVIPAYQEAGRLPETLAQLGVFVRDCGYSVEVLIVVEECPDRTLEIATQFASTQAQFAVVVNGGQFGKGRAVRTGMLRARGRFILFMDADLSVPLSEVPKFLKHFATQPDVDVLIGDRQHAESDIVRRQTRLREGMGQVFNGFVRVLSGLRWRDTQCGFKAFRRPAARAVFRRLTIDGFAFDVEALVLAERLGLRVESMPVVWINSADSKVRILQDSARMLRDAFRVKRRVHATLRRERFAGTPVPDLEE